jgi:hypothetical protein
LHVRCGMPRTSPRPEVDSRFLQISRDPRIIHGLYRHCDEWCEFCRLTERCLSFRCRMELRRRQGRTPADSTFGTAAEAIEFGRQLALIEGTADADPTPPDAYGRTLDAVTDDRLATLALHYATRSARLVRAPRSAAMGSAPPGRPTPAQVVLWFHSRVYFKTTRALVGKALADAGISHWRAEASICAGQALLAIARSRHVLERWPDADGECRDLIALLDAIADGLRDQFPGVRPDPHGQCASTSGTEV